LLGGFPLKFVIKDSADVIIRTVDNISGVNDTSSTASEWTSSGLTPTYISATQFSVVGDQTAIFQVNRRVRTTNTGGFIYGRITVSAFATGITTVTVLNDTGSMDSGLSAVAYGFLSFSPTSIPFALYAGFGTNQIQPISAVANTPANSLTISASLLGLEFRSATLTSGNVTSVSGTPANLVVPSTATLGTINAIQSRLVVLALNNAGTIELAVVNSSGISNLTETGLISTTAISAGATSASVVYSTTARSNLSYRVLGYIESTQATAGTWATAPSTIQGAGGNALTAMSSLGYGQTYQNVTASRAVNTTYYNTTGRPIFVSASPQSTAVAYPFMTITQAGVSVAIFGSNQYNTGTFANVSAVVPPGAAYLVNMNLGTVSLAVNTWFELR
jgi:hypothetical protein